MTINLLMEANVSDKQSHACSGEFCTFFLANFARVSGGASTCLTVMGTGLFVE